VYKHPTGCHIGCTTVLTTGWMFVYTMQPVVQPIVQLVCQPVVSCERGISNTNNKRLSYRRGTARRAVSVEVLFTNAQLYEKSYFKRLAIDE